MTDSDTATQHAHSLAAEIGSIDDVNDATRRVNNILDELRKRTNGQKVRIDITEVDDE